MFAFFNVTFVTEGIRKAFYPRVGHETNTGKYEQNSRNIFHNSLLFIESKKLRFSQLRIF